MKRIGPWLVMLILLFISAGVGAAADSTWQEIRGGAITDGLTMEAVHVSSSPERDLLEFVFDGEPGYYELRYTSYPHRAVISLSVRRVLKGPPEPTDLTTTILPLLTLDDASIRYYLQFSQAVFLQVKKLPDRLQIVIEADDSLREKDVRWSLRTQPLRGEELGAAEEWLAYVHGLPGQPIHGAGGWVIEADLLPTWNEAAVLRDQLYAADSPWDLVIEERSPGQAVSHVPSPHHYWDILVKDRIFDRHYLQGRVWYPRINGLPDAAVQTALNEAVEGWVNQRIDAVAAQASADQPDSPYPMFVEFDLTRNDDTFLSFTVISYAFTGGAHGVQEERPWNLHVPSGLEPNLAALFADWETARTIIAAAIEDEIRASGEQYFIDQFAVSDLCPDQPYYLTPESLVVLFDQYSIAPGYFGQPRFFTALDDLPPLLSDVRTGP